ncbi:MAG: ABC-F family ATP-binding cassette domain-containing protein [Puniceicoccales bacterium]|jgi:ATP-binding cassette subfamily F protein 3|nr:ABC-F family ATP-binding cassette domain-containing protein [Puniceicoccales bacterium]
MIDIENLTYRVGARLLFEDATLHLPSGGKIGLIGPNGCGKTTLFRIIFGEEKIDGGEIFIKPGAKLVRVKQEIDDFELPLIEFIVRADAEFVQLRRIIDGAENASAEDVSHACDRYAMIDGYSAEARAANILIGLGFGNVDMGKKLREFSGGWQVRASLAATLFAPSDCLLLDEPTNHLDLETAMWLENFLRKTDKMLLMISHEKQFLNKICNYIVSISDRHLLLFRGNYDTHVATRDRQETALVKNIENLQKKREHMQSFVDRFGAKATKAKQAQSRIKAIEKMEIPKMPSVPSGMKISFSQPRPRVDKKLITLENVTAGYGEKIVLKSVNLCVTFGEKIALLGANGNGKSTLAKVLSGRLAPISGKVTAAKNLKISYFSQQQADELNMESTPTETIGKIARSFSETQVRAHLARFGITQARSGTQTKNLSGGEKARVLLAINSIFEPHAMIFDEPTNHLDIDAREALVAAINAYEGAVVLITHDFFALSKTCDKFFIVSGGKCTPFDGTLEDYRALLLSGGAEQTSAAAGAKGAKAPSAAKNENKSRTRQLLALEKMIAEMEKEKANLEKKMSNSCDADACKLYADICKKLTQLENEWLSANG